MISKIHNTRLLEIVGGILRFVAILLSIAVIYEGQVLGVALLIAAIYIDLILPARTGSIIAVAAKLFLFMQASIIWVFLTKMEAFTTETGTSMRSGKYVDPFIRSLQSDSQSQSQAPVRSVANKIVEQNMKTSQQFQRHASFVLDSEPQEQQAQAHSNSALVLTSYPVHDVWRKSPALMRVFVTVSNLPPEVDHPDLRLRSSEEVRRGLATVFNELPEAGFLPDHRNPCWIPQGKGLACLPYSYVLGQPKCGSSDLYERLRRHPDVEPPDHKEVRWFTRGEFMDNAMLPETSKLLPTHIRRDVKLSPESSIFTFTSHFDSASKNIATRPSEVITFDGGPHTFWWPLQQPNGSVDPDDLPIPQILREMQPTARFIITLADPVRRLYSDYYFLNDDKTVYRRGGPHNNGQAQQQAPHEEPKSAQQLHVRVQKQINDFKDCVSAKTVSLARSSPAPGQVRRQESVSGLWFRASQICAHDRHTFGKAGWGRLSIGLYALYMEKWLEHFPLEQFLVLRLEDYDSDPRSYMIRIFEFLGLREPTEPEWGPILIAQRANQYKQPREPMNPETEKILREFYQVYNDILVTMLENPGYSWRDSSLNNFNYLGQRQIVKNQAAQISTERGALNKRTLGMQDPGEPPWYIHTTQNLAVDPELPNISWPRGTFSTEGLPEGDGVISDMLRKFIDLKRPPRTEDEAGMQLCCAVLGLDYTALRFLLVDVGVPATLVHKKDGQRPPIVSLAVLGTMADAHSKSAVFALLKGQPLWLDAHMDPQLPKPQHSVHAKDILESMDTAVIGVAKWLLRAGANINARDSNGFSAFDYASVGGLSGLVRLLLETSSSSDVHFDLNARERQADKRTPLHYALGYGRVDIAKLLMKHGANLNLPDRWNVTAYDLLANPGLITSDDASTFFGVKQRVVRTIDRVLHPEQLPHVTDPKLSGGNVSTNDLRDYYRSWPGGTGGWGPERLKGYEDDMRCDIDQYWADEITGDQIFDNYIARNLPVLVRGLVHNWEAVNAYKVTQLNETHGETKVTVSDIPYAEKFGGEDTTNMLLRDYIEEVRQHRLVGGTHPWYVFRGHPISSAENEWSLVPENVCPTPPTLQKAFDRLSHSSLVPADIGTRRVFVNAQWAFGGEGSGAPVHYHNTAWNALVYGAKKWVIYPPEHQVMSNRQILHYIETDMQDFASRSHGKGFTPKTCVQTAGDVMIIPESWGHGVLNIQESIAVATEAKPSMWRIRPGNQIFTILPNNNRREKPPRAPLPSPHYKYKHKNQ